MSVNQTSHTLLQRALNLDDEEAWEILYKRYHTFILHILRQYGIHDAEDLAQEVLLGLTKKLKSYDRSKAKFRTWLNTVTKNALFEYSRKKNRRLKLLDKYMGDVIGDSAEEDQLEKHVEEEWKAYVSKIAFNKVKQSYRGNAIRVFELAVAGKTNPEISEALGLSLSSVTTLKKRVKSSLHAAVRATIADLEQY